MQKTIRHTLEKNELMLLYQPLTDIRKKIVCAEALVRWRHPEKAYSILPISYPWRKAAGSFVPG